MLQRSWMQELPHLHKLIHAIDSHPRAVLQDTVTLIGIGITHHLQEATSCSGNALVKHTSKLTIGMCLSQPTARTLQVLQQTILAVLTDSAIRIVWTHATWPNVVRTMPDDMDIALMPLTRTIPAGRPARLAVLLLVL
jgi:hypothetical protein